MRTPSFFVHLLLLCFALAGWAKDTPIQWYQSLDKKQVQLRVDLFLSTTCNHCQEANQFFTELGNHEPWLDIHRHFINQDKAALDLFSRYIKQQPNSLNNYAVPAIFFCGSRWTGFINAKATGEKLIQSMAFCRQQIENYGYLPPKTVDVLQRWASANWYDSAISKKNHSPVFFVPLLSLIDALNPCALFGLFTIFSFILFQEGLKARVQLGFLMLFVEVLLHYFQQTHTPLYYNFVAILNIPAAFIGGVFLGFLILFRSKIIQGYFFSRRKLLAFTLASIMVLMVQSRQQHCLPDFGLIFQQWLAGQSLTLNQQWAYGLLYQVVFILCSGAIILFFIFALHYSKAKHYQQQLRQAAWAVLSITALILVIYPGLLSKLSLSFIILGLAVLIGWLLGDKTRE